MGTSETGQSSAATEIPSLARQRLADQIADVLRAQMLTGQLKPGAPIHERETSQALGVSRTPLREAILILEAEGLVETSPSRSPIVADPDMDELTQLLVVQAELEALAGALACENATDKQLIAVRALYESMQQSTDKPDTVAHFKTDMAFHDAIVNASGNLALKKTHGQYNSRLWRARYVTSRRRSGRAVSMADHLAIIVSLEKRNPKEAADNLRRHLYTAISALSKLSDTVPYDAR